MISDEAVEAAAREIHGDLSMARWSDLGTLTKERYMDVARRALEAAAPYMREAAMEPMTQQIGTLPAEYQPNKPFSPNKTDVIITNPYRSQA